MSSGTHLITLSVLREYLRRKTILRVSRLAGMLIMFVLLFIAITPTGNDTYYSMISVGSVTYQGFVHSPAGVVSVCFWTRKNWNGWRWDTGVTYFFLISNYVARATALFESSEAFFRRNIRGRLLGSLENALDRKVMHIRDCAAHELAASHTQKICYCTYLATYALALACFELYSSFLGPLLWVLLSLIWGSLQLLAPRTALAESGGVAEENRLGFGQIIALMLLTLPLVAACEAYYGQSYNDPSSGV